jgi:hypothetical protein
MNDPFAASTPMGLQASVLATAHARLVDADATMLMPPLSPHHHR